MVLEHERSFAIFVRSKTHREETCISYIFFPAVDQVHKDSPLRRPSHRQDRREARANAENSTTSYGSKDYENYGMCTSHGDRFRLKFEIRMLHHNAPGRILPEKVTISIVTRRGTTALQRRARTDRVGRHFSTERKANFVVRNRYV